MKISGIEENFKGNSKEFQLVSIKISMVFNWFSPFFSFLFFSFLKEKPLRDGPARRSIAAAGG